MYSCFETLITHDSATFGRFYTLLILLIPAIITVYHQMLFSSAQSSGTCVSKYLFHTRGTELLQQSTVHFTLYSSFFMSLFYFLFLFLVVVLLLLSSSTV